MSEAMPGFSPPTSRVRLSFIGAMDEFRAEGRGTATDDTMLGREIRDFGLDWQDPGRFEAYAAYLRDQAREDAPRRPGYVPSTTLWWVDGEEYLGRLAIRHRLTAELRRDGGHIGYNVVPQHRRQGHATAMLGVLARDSVAGGGRAGYAAALTGPDRSRAAGGFPGLRAFVPAPGNPGAATTFSDQQRSAGVHACGSVSLRVSPTMTCDGWHRCATDCRPPGGRFTGRHPAGRQPSARLPHTAGQSAGQQPGGAVFGHSVSGQKVSGRRGSG